MQQASGAGAAPGRSEAQALASGAGAAPGRSGAQVVAQGVGANFCGSSGVLTAQERSTTRSVTVYQAEARGEARVGDVLADPPGHNSLGEEAKVSLALGMPLGQMGLSLMQCTQIEVRTSQTRTRQVHQLSPHYVLDRNR